MRTQRENLAWAAGFFDGEGCVSYSASRSGGDGQKARSQHLRVVICNTHIPALERFQSAVGGLGAIYTAGHNRKKPTYQWSVGSFEHCQAVMAMLWPFMCPEKRGNFERAMTAFKAKMRPPTPERNLFAQLRRGLVRYDAATRSWIPKP